MITRLRILGFGIALLAFAGCGGGGGGGGGDPVVTPPPSEDVTITSANAVAVASDVYISIGDAASLGDFGAGGLIGAAGPASPTLSKSAATLATKSGITGSAETGSLIAAVFGPEQSPCAVSGSVTVSGDIQDPQTLSSGDTITLRFNNCDDGDGQVVNGSLTMTIDTVSGDLNTQFFALGVTLRFQSLSVLELGDTTLVNGSVSMLVDSTDYPVTVASLSSPSLSVTSGGQTATLSNYDTTVTVDESSQPPAFSLTSSGRVDLPAQGGAVTYTVRALFTDFGDSDPDAGVLFIRGANNASITLTVQSATQLQLEMDYDGNGSVDETVVLTWVEFET